VDVLLLEHLLVRELDLAVKVLKSCGLAKAEDLVVDEAILEVVKLVDVLHKGWGRVKHDIILGK